MELGVYSFGDVQKDPVTGELGSTAEAMRNLVEAIRVADEVGLDYFGVGEHHTREMPASAAAVVLAGAATVTKNIRLGSSVTVLSTDDPVRVFQQFATVDALSNGRAEITAGRGSSKESYPLFGFDLADYDQLYADKLDLLQLLNRHETVTWSGEYRPALQGALVVPRPENGELALWLGTGGSPGSSVRAGRRGLPVIYGIIGGEPARFAPLADLYRQAAAQSNTPSEKIRVGITNPGFIGDDGQKTRDMWWGHWSTRMEMISAQRGFPMMSRDRYQRTATGTGALFVGHPEEIAERIITLHRAMGHDRQILEMDYGHVPHKDLLHSIELLGTRVKPLVDAELGTTRKPPAHTSTPTPEGAPA
ncbi:LLM class flavin-dependent oxidoreductase [Pseudarthrobacter oxydans]|jgi:probable LLM family oxidoreductase|uniref:Putative oxidoreductase protein n=2 Tax=unclassified Arthrobacter TaxID=235627 RepID=I3W1C1_9MICC|nr:MULTISPECIES: LLM class flavin-dependent oxidoreductase [unclassified Arthrobacter]AFK89398.1 putative oxidoreductase protein [Arthrobacter sp. J3.40]AFK89650.1 putative oxidoreductase protein [Arthrobacter sp. J3.53]